MKATADAGEARISWRQAPRTLRAAFPRVFRGESARRGGQRGMTLVELLAALAILAILFALLFMPLMKSFGYIHTSNVRMEVQNVGRSLFESIIREVSDATYIYDNVDDPTLSSLVMVLPQGVGANANQQDPNNPVPPTNKVPILIPPGPGMDYNVTSPLHVHYQLGLSRVFSKADPNTPLEYSNGWEMESTDLRSAGAGPTPAGPQADNFYRLLRAEYYPYQDAAVTPDTQALRFVLSKVLGALMPPGRDDFREPGMLIDDSLFTRKRNDTRLRDSVDTAKRRRLLEQNGLLIGMTPRSEIDLSWATFTPGASGTGAWSVKPGIRFESKLVQNEALDPLLSGSSDYPGAYRADYGHWQTVRRKAWAATTALPVWARFFQVFDVQVSQRYAAKTREYYLSIGRDDSSLTTATDSYYVFRKDDPAVADPAQGVWPKNDLPVFNETRYKQYIDLFRQGPGPSDTPYSFWQANNPYDTSLLPTNSAEPYWPQMAFLTDPEHGTVNFRLDPPVRQPSDTEPQPPGPLAPFQIPYGSTGDSGYEPPLDGSTADWIIPDVKLARASATYSNGDGTTWIRIPAETMRVMVGVPDVAGNLVWKAYTRASQRTLLGPGEFWFDELTGHLAFDPDNYSGDWTDYSKVKIRVWYQLQTNVQRRNNGGVANINSSDGHSVTASYFTKELWRVILALRAYDKDSGRAQSFNLSATVRPRNLR